MDDWTEMDTVNKIDLFLQSCVDQQNFIFKFANLSFEVHVLWLLHIKLHASCDKAEEIWLTLFQGNGVCSQNRYVTGDHSFKHGCFPI